MDCNRSNELMSLAIDEMISDKELAELKTHLLSCNGCKEEYELLQSIQQSLAIIGSEEAELPSGFHTELMQNIQDIDTQSHDEIMSKNQTLPLWRRVNRMYMNVAAVMVMVVVFALIGINNLDYMQQSNDSALMENTYTTESAKEESTASSAPEMDMTTEKKAAEAVVEDALPTLEYKTSDSAEMAAEEPEVSVMMEEAEVATTEITFTEETSALETTDEGESAPEIERVTVEDSDSILMSYEDDDVIDSESEVAVTESGNHLARDGSEDQKSPRSVENHRDLSFDERETEDQVPAGLGLMILGGFVGIMILSMMFILRKLK